MYEDYNHRPVLFMGTHTGEAFCHRLFYGKNTIILEFNGHRHERFVFFSRSTRVFTAARIREDNSFRSDLTLVKQTFSCVVGLLRVWFRGKIQNVLHVCVCVYHKKRNRAVKFLSDLKKRVYMQILIM